MPRPDIWFLWGLAGAVILVPLVAGLIGYCALPVMDASHPDPTNTPQATTEQAVGK
jgi:hypothetical protein